MPKITFFVFLFAFLFLFRIVHAQSDSVELSISPTTVNYGDKVSVYVSNLPKTNAGYLVNVRFSSASVSGAGNVASLQILTSSNGTCTVRVPSDAWTSITTPSCTGNGPFEFAGGLDTSKIGVDQNSTMDSNYSVVLGGSISDNLAAGTFTIKAPVTNNSTFRIDSIIPNPAQPGSSVNINLSGTKSGDYSYGISGNTIQTGRCIASTCSLRLTIPNEITAPSVNVIVIDSNNNRQSSALNINLPTPITNNLPANNISNSFKDISCTGKECTNANSKCPDGQPGVNTALGCIPTQPKDLINGLFRFAASAGGGIALLLMIFGAFQMIASAGNPDTLKKGRDQFTSAVIGLLFVIFATLLLQIIGLDILGLPGFRP